MTKKRDYKTPLLFLATFLAGAGFGMYFFMLRHPIKIMCMTMIQPGTFQ